MKKLLNGIVDYRRRVRPTMKGKFAALAFGQKPDTMLIACSDSRVAVNVFASTDPGDLFVVRNVGNMIAPSNTAGISHNDLSEVAALEFAVEVLKVSSIIVCGHSECGAILALMNGRGNVQSPHLRDWIANAEDALDPSKFTFHAAKPFAAQNLVSQKNVLLQLEHLRSYPFVQKRIADGSLRLYGWWFDIAEAEVYMWDDQQKSFLLLDEIRAATLAGRLP